MKSIYFLLIPLAGYLIFLVCKAIYKRGYLKGSSGLLITLFLVSCSSKETSTLHTSKTSADSLLMAYISSLNDTIVVKEIEYAKKLNVEPPQSKIPLPLFGVLTSTKGMEYAFSIDMHPRNSDLSLASDSKLSIRFFNKLEKSKP